MAGNVITLYAIFDAFKNSSRQVMRGENAFKSGHVKRFTFDSAVQPFKVSGEVQASMRKKNYSVEIAYDGEEGVRDMQCTCPRGRVVCHHMAALLFHAHYNVSATDVPCQWNAPKHSGDEKLLTQREMYPLQFQPIQANVPVEKINKFKEQIGPTSVIGFSWLLKEEATSSFMELVIPVEGLIYSEEYATAQDKDQFLKEKCTLPPEKILKIAKETVGQHANENWLVARKMRLTSSKFGAVLLACRRNKYPPSLFKSLVEGYNLDGVLAVQWGKDCEGTAFQKFCEVTDIAATPTGMWFHQSGLLAASPDGLIDEDAVLEIKCPYKYRDGTLKQGVQDKKYFFYYEGENIIINKEHAYYHQVQGQLHLTNRSKCYFFVWTPAEYEIFEIEKDEAWGENIDVLIKFYIDKFIPYLIKHS